MNVFYKTNIDWPTASVVLVLVVVNTTSKKCKIYNIVWPMFLLILQFQIIFLTIHSWGNLLKRSLRVPNIYKPATHESQNKKKGNAHFVWMRNIFWIKDPHFSVYIMKWNASEVCLLFELKNVDGEMRMNTRIMVRTIVVVDRKTRHGRRQDFLLLKALQVTNRSLFC